MRVLSIAPELPSADRPGSMAPTARQIQSLRMWGVESTTIDMRGLPKLKYLMAIPRVRRAVRSCDLVHAHFGYCGWLARVQQSKPIVLSLMGSDVYGDTLAHGKPGVVSSTIAKLNRRWLAPYVAAVIVKSQQMADMIPTVPTTVIPNGVDMDAFCPQPRHEACEQLGWQPGPLRVLFPGNPENPRKGFDLASAAVTRASQLLGQSIELVPMWGVPPQRTPLYMNACDAMLLASHAEGSPNVVKEAMACNSRIVSSPVGDVPQLLADVPGCRVPPRETEAVARAVVDLLTGDDASEGRQRLEELGLSLRAIARRVCDVYEGVLGRPVPVQPEQASPQPSAVADERLPASRRAVQEVTS